MTEILYPRARYLGATDKTRVGELVKDDEVAGPSEAGDRAEHRPSAHRKRQRGLRPLEVRDLPLEFEVQLRRPGQRASSHRRADAVARSVVGGDGADFRMHAHSEVIIGAELETGAPVQLNRRAGVLDGRNAEEHPLRNRQFFARRNPLLVQKRQTSIKNVSHGSRPS